jgi:hypothetical protein
MSDIAELMRAANPIPDPETALTADEFGALLLLTNTRSGNVDVQQLTKPAEPEHKQRRGWLVAAAAFAVAIVFVGAAMLLARPAAELPPATTPPTTEAVPPTTQAAPPTTQAAVEEQVVESTATTAAPANEALSAEEEAFVEEFVAAFNAADETAFLALSSPSVEVSTGIRFNAGIDRWTDEVRWRWALQQQWEVESCKIWYSAINCQLSITGDDPPYINGPLSAVARLIVTDGVVTSLTLNEDQGAIIANVGAFYDWVEINHSEKLDLIRSGGVPGAPILTAESIAILQELLPLWKATLNE